MMDRIRTYLSARRAAVLLPLVALLAAACSPSETAPAGSGAEAPGPPRGAAGGAVPASLQNARELVYCVPQISTCYSIELIGAVVAGGGNLCLKDSCQSFKRYLDHYEADSVDAFHCPLERPFRAEIPCFPVYDGVPEGHELWAGADEFPILLNDPPPPVHAGGEPYPHGTFPPELAVVWENVTGKLMEPGAFLGTRACIRIGNEMPEPFGHVRNQWLFSYDEEPHDPMAAIEADLRAAAVEYESITVRSAEYYDERYDSETFYNWLATGNSGFDAVAALERLGAEVHSEASVESNAFPYLRRPYKYYQVKLHGLEEDSIPIRLFNAHPIQFNDSCIHDDVEGSELALPLLAGGLYTAFGDDVVFHELEPEASAELGRYTFWQRFGGHAIDPLPEGETLTAP